MKIVAQTLRELMIWLPADARRYLKRYVVVSCLLAVLDIVAVMLLAISLAPMISGTAIRLPIMKTSDPASCGASR